MDKNILWKFEWDCGRQGNVEGLFIATKEKIFDTIGKQVYFGEILGKHSEIFGTLESCDLQKINASNELVEGLLALFGNTVSGYNPLEYVYNDDEDGDDE